MGALELALRSMLAGVFLAALTKLRSGPERASFVAQVRFLTALPGRPALVAAAVVAAGEVAAVPLLLTPLWPQAGLVLAAVLSGAFLAGTVSALGRGHRAACRCFGFGGTPLGFAHVGRNALLAAAGLTGLLLPDHAQPSGSGAVVAVAGGMAAAVVAVLSADLAALLRGPDLATGGLYQDSSAKEIP